MRAKENLIGKRFSYLTVIAESESLRSPSGCVSSAWLCQCDCSVQLIRRTRDLKRKDNQSCGCKTPLFLRKFSPVHSSARKIWMSNYGDGDLTFEKFLELAAQDCYYCGSKPSNIYNPFKDKEEYIFVYSGLDRLDSNKNHDVDNCVPCCFICNRMKSNMTSVEFLSLLRKIVERHKG